MRTISGICFSEEASVKYVVSTHRAPRAIGPYSQAIVANGFVFVSGQIPVDPMTDQLVESDVAEQTLFVLENLKGIIESIGSSFENTVKVTVYLKDMSDYAAMNEVYSRYFPSEPPARSTVEVARLPRDVRIEIDLIATI
jgi:2-iminobutanoate/2-iminopropanoate deaminase